jgi:predicted lipoprotein
LALDLSLYLLFPSFSEALISKFAEYRRSLFASSAENIANYAAGFSRSFKGLDGKTLQWKGYWPALSRFFINKSIVLS